MDYQVKQFCWRYKQFCWQNNGTCLIVVARGILDRTAFLRVFREIVEVTKPLDGCKVLFDLQDTTCDLEIDDVVELKFDINVETNAAASRLKLAMVTTPHQEQYGRLRPLSLPVAQLGIKVAVFYEEKRAIDWLASAE